MITLPPTDADLQAFVDLQLDAIDQRRVRAWLASHPADAARVAAWQLEARQLRMALGDEGSRAANPALNPAAVRQRLRQRRWRSWGQAAMLVLALGIGGLGGWQARDAALDKGPGLPMTDALQAHRLFAEAGSLPADFEVRSDGELQAWLDRRFDHASRLPDLREAGFKAVSARLLSTNQGPAAMVLYQDPSGGRVTFYIRPPGPDNGLLPRGSRRDGELQAEYWSGPGYNYAVVSRADGPALPWLRTLPTI